MFVQYPTVTHVSVVPLDASQMSFYSQSVGTSFHQGIQAENLSYYGHLKSQFYYDLMKQVQSIVGFTIIVTQASKDLFGLTLVISAGVGKVVL